ncbi:tRNA pseudouridine13 synthase [Pseudoscourfieldia marina]
MVAPSRDEDGGNAKTVTDASAFIAPLYMASSSLGSSHSSFTCVLKHRYGDFVVREVDPDGQIASLTPQEASEDAAVHAACNAEREWEEETKKAHAPTPSADAGAEAHDNNEKKRTHEPASLEEAMAAARAVVVEQTESNVDAEQLQALVDDAVNNKQSRSVTLPTPLDDKTKRTNVHTAIRLLSEAVEAAHSLSLVSCSAKNGSDDDNKHRIEVRVVAAGSKQARDSQRRKNGSPAIPTHVAFVVRKTNVDTASTARALQSMLMPHGAQGKGNARQHHHQKSAAAAAGSIPGTVTFAGTKDKRGITYQFMSAARTFPRYIAKAARKLRGVAVGQFKVVNERIYLGNLRGNRFNIVLRNLADDAQANADKACASLRQSGFFNFYGLQRFGRGVAHTHKIGQMLLANRPDAAVRMVLLACDAETALSEADAAADDAGAPRGAWPTGNLEAALAVTKTRPNDSFIEKDLSIALRRRVEAANSTRRKDPTARGWLTREELAAAFSESLPKTTCMMYLHAFQSAAFNAAVSARALAHGSAPARAGELVLVDEDDGAGGGGGVEDLCDAEEEGGGESLPRVRLVTEQEAEANAIPVSRVVLPLPGRFCTYPLDAATLDAYAPFATDAGINLQRLRTRLAWLEKHDNDVGAALRALAGAGGNDGAVVDELEGRKGKHPLLTVAALPGAYRKVVCVPQDVEWRFVRHATHDEDLLDVCGNVLSARNVESKSAPEQGDVCGTGSLLSLCVDFTLPASAYATMAVRELTKQPSDTLVP